MFWNFIFKKYTALIIKFNILTVFLHLILTPWSMFESLRDTAANLAHDLGTLLDEAREEGMHREERAAVGELRAAS